MIDFAKSAGVTNSQALIANAVAYAQHPRNALNINGVVPSTPFCQNAPKNAELQGVFHAQLDGVDPGLFGSPALGVFPFGQREFSYYCAYLQAAHWIFYSRHLPLRPDPGRQHLRLQLNAPTVKPKS